MPSPLDLATVKLRKAEQHLKEARKRLDRHPCYEHRMELTAAESAHEAAIEYRRDLRESFAAT